MLDHQFDVKLFVGVRKHASTSEAEVANSNCRQNLVVEEMLAYVLHTDQRPINSNTDAKYRIGPTNASH